MAAFRRKAAKDAQSWCVGEITPISLTAQLVRNLQGRSCQQAMIRSMKDLARGLNLLRLSEFSGSSGVVSFYSWWGNRPLIVTETNRESSRNLHRGRLNRNMGDHKATSGVFRSFNIYGSFIQCMWGSSTSSHEGGTNAWFVIFFLLLLLLPLCLRAGRHRISMSSRGAS